MATRPGRSEFSSGKSRAGHPDSDYQSQRNLPWEVAQRNGGSKRGGYTGMMQLQAQHRLDATVVSESEEDMLYVYGNPDTSVPDEKIVQEPAVRPTGFYKAPKLRYGVDRQA